MKKFSVLLIILLLFPFIYVEAASTPRVLTLDATTSDTTITYNGTIEDGSYAVMCKLLNNNNEEIDLLSSSVTNNSFEGSFVVSEKANYKVACANYEGGDIKEVEVSFDDDTVTDTNKNNTNAKKVNNASNVKTSDNIIIFIMIGIISMCAIISLIIIKKKRA